MSDLPEWNNDPILGNDGYPSEKELSRIRRWPIHSARDIRNLLGYVQIRWTNSNYFEPIPLNDTLFKISTSGWSGNEAMIEALERNPLFWMMCWVSSRRGGHYEFSIPGDNP